MNGLFNSGLTGWQLVGAILALAIGVVAVRISFQFDVNKYLDSRRDKMQQRLKNACTHTVLIPHDDNRIEVKSFMVSPPGTVQWQCQRCGYISYQQEDEYNKAAEYYAKNPDVYLKKNKKFAKLLKRSGQS